MEEKKYLLTFPQQNIALMEQVNKNTAINNITAMININESFDAKACQATINHIILCNDAMRLKVINQNGDFLQQIQDFKTFKFEVLDMKDYTQEQIEAYKSEYAKEPLSLEGQIFDFKILDYGKGKGCIILKIHHVICDAWSCSLIANQIIEDLKKIKNGEELDERILPSYIEHVDSEKEYKESEKWSVDEKYWKEYLSGVEECISLKSKNNVTNIAKRYTVRLDEELTSKFQHFCSEQKISPYTLFLTALSAYISRIRECQDFVLGTPILNRSNFREKQMLGMFVSTIPIRFKLNEDMKMLDIAKNVSSNTMSLFRHQKYPYSKIIENFRKKSSIKKNLYNIIVSYQNAKADIDDSNIYATDWVFPEYIEDELQIHITDMNNTGSFLLYYDYLIDIFCETEIKLLHERIINIILQLVDNQDITLNELDVITNQERELIQSFNNTQTDYPRDETVIELFEKNVQEHPDNIALVFEGESMTYKKLDDLANHLAHYLKKVKKVQEGDVVAITADKSFELMISILACLKCGACYLPIEKDVPKDRIEYMLADAKCKIRLTDDFTLKNSSGEVVEINTIIYNQENYGKATLRKPSYNYDSIVYIMYTSGTTGMPKGVQVCNRNIVRLVKNTNYITFNNDDRIIQTGATSFDASTLEFWGSFLNGLPLYLIPKEKLLDVSYLEKFLRDNNITIMWLTAPLFNNMVSYKATMFSSLRVLLIGGDVLSPTHVDKVLESCPNIKLVNGYGPTENTTFSCCYEITQQGQSSIPIGKPIANSTCYIVDSKLRLLPLYVEGELLVSGDGVSKGYINNIEKTHASFIKNPYETDTMAYKTGDICYFDTDGNVHILGRRDNQIKINGYRIELEEIKNMALRNTNIKDCYVTIKQNQKSKEIVLLYTTFDNIKLAELKQFLRRRLPNYMIPKYLIELDEIPLNKNGKLDRNSILQIIKKAEEEKGVKVQEYKGVYKEIYEVFKEILGKSKIGINDNFFEIGGDSLLAIKAVTAFIARDLKVTYSDFYKNPNIQQLGDFLTLPVVVESISKEIDSFEYNQINKLLVNNKVDKKLENDFDIGNILITGVTGFLGAHVLDEYMKSNTGKIYCLIRDKDGVYVEERLRNRLRFFFGSKYDNEIGKRIIIVPGDLDNEIIINDRNDYNTIKRKVTTIIHCAANVKHFGSVDTFKRVNVQAVENLVKFCLHNKKRLIHVSTLSVSGNILETGQIQQDNIPNGTIYNENNLYIGQNLDNVYAYTKFLAEKIVLDAVINDNLDAKIMRMGNLTGRVTDGRFQPNVGENAFANRLKAFITLSVIPNNILKFYLEFTPIDYAARAVLLLSKCNKQYQVFHLFNHKHVQMEDALAAFEKVDIHLKNITKEEMTQLIEMYSKSKDANTISGIILDVNKNKEIDYSPNIIIKSDFTINILKQLGFEWPAIGDEYICQYINYLYDINFLTREQREDS